MCRFQNRTGIWDAVLMLVTELGNDCPGSEYICLESEVSVSRSPGDDGREGSVRDTRQSQRSVFCLSPSEHPTPGEGRVRNVVGCKKTEMFS